MLHARYVGAADTDDFSRWLIAWVWHWSASLVVTAKAAVVKDPVWALMEAARNQFGRAITETEAIEIVDEAAGARKRLSADNLARFLGVTYEQRQALRLTTIGSTDVKKRARQELRKRKARLRKECKRRASGMRPQSESLSATKPWEKLGMSRRTWYRQNKAGSRDGTTLAPPIFLSSGDKTVPPEGKKGLPSGAVAPKKARGLPSSQIAPTLAADVYETLPLELRLLALGLELPMVGEKLAAAA